jgi:hypothetical protein
MSLILSPKNNYVIGLVSSIKKIMCDGEYLNKDSNKVDDYPNHYEKLECLPLSLSF